jgi:predicted transposase/invertase (TIGR01784 family)
LIENISLAAAAKSSVSAEKLVALMLVASNKVIDKVMLNRLWEEFKTMTKLKIFEVAEEKGIEKGIELDKRETAELMMADNEPIEKIIRYTGLTIEKLTALKNELNLA